MFVSNLPYGQNAYNRNQNSLRGSWDLGNLGNLSGKVEMNMFGGLEKTSSRIAIAAALGLTLGGFAFHATPAKAADLGGDCCADLEERVAELEATTVRKGNKKVSVTLSGWVVKSMNFWDSGDEDGFAVGGKDYDLGSRFAITGSATIAPGWSGGFNLTVTADGTNFGVFSNQNDEFNSVNAIFYGNTFGGINTLYSYIYIKSDTLGTLNWGHLSPASDNPAVLADASGTVIESNFVGFEGPGFALSSKQAGTGNGGARWAEFWTTDSAIANGADAFGGAEPAVRYDSPTWGGFRFETSYGTAALVPELLDAVVADYPFGTALGSLYPNTDDSHFWDIAAFYTADWNSIKLSLAYAYTWMESNPLNGGEEDIHQVGGTILHKPSGLGVYAMGQWEIASKSDSSVCAIGGCLISDLYYVNGDNLMPDTDMWGIKPFWRKSWSPIGTTTIYGEYAEYNNFYAASLANGVNFNAMNINCVDCIVSGSELQRWGLGVVQEIDSAAMHVWLRWQHQDLSVDLHDNFDGQKYGTSFDDFDLFQAGGIIFF